MRCEPTAYYNLKRNKRTITSFLFCTALVEQFMATSYIEIKRQ